MTAFQPLANAVNKPAIARQRGAGLIPDDRFERLLRPDEWMALPTAVRRRFAYKAGPGQSVLYRGVTTELKQTIAGTILAHAARLIGAPLPLNRKSEQRPAIVAITDVPDSGGQIWTRLYSRGALFPQAINSMKRFSGETGLEEHVGGGVSMSLKLSVSDGALFFSSADYFLTFFGLRIKLPALLTPGRMVIGHHDMGEGAFAFTLTLAHPNLGVIISQTTIFHDMEEAHHD